MFCKTLITYFAQPCSMIVSSFDQHSCDQLNMSNHSLPAWENDLPFSDKSAVSITREQNIICNKKLICRQLFAVMW